MCSSLALFNEVDLSLHTHCSTCVVITRCLYLNPDERYGCEVIQCPNECGHKFHMCKTEEHLTLCPMSRVPCTNAAYGCPLWMLRKDTNSHLTHCPASLLYCKMERNRRPLSDSAKKQLKTARGLIDLNEVEAKRDAVDLFLALSDQNKINKSYCYSRQIRKLYSNFFCKHHPPLPMLRPEPYYPLNEQPQSVSDSRAYNIEGNTSDEEEKRRKKAMAPVARECVICKIDPSSQHLHLLGSMVAVNEDENANETELLQSTATIRKGLNSKLLNPLSEFYQKHNLLVDITAEFLPAHCQKPRNYYTIVCSETVRRDEHAQHYANVHADTVSALDGWGLIRCPLFLYGCEMYHRRLVPADGTGNIIYNPILDTLVLTKSNLLTESESTLANMNTTLILLPFDVLCTVCTYLDSASLNCLSRTCQTLRRVCRFLLPQRGIVQLSWSKIVDQNGRSSWRNVGRKWTYSKCFETVPKWRVVPADRLVDHVQQCPHYDPVIHTDPMPVLTFL